MSGFVRCRNLLVRAIQHPQALNTAQAKPWMLQRTACLGIHALTSERRPYHLPSGIRRPFTSESRAMSTQHQPRSPASNEGFDPNEPDDDDYGIDKWNKSGPEPDIERLPIVKVLDINRVAVVKKGGKVLSFSAIVVCGNGQGLAGIGKGKDAEVSRAVEKAVVRAHKTRNLHYFELYDRRTIFHNVTHRFKKTKIVALAAKEGVGLKTNNLISDMCECIGIEDLCAKVHGSTNPHNLARAFWETMLKIRTPEAWSRLKGRAMLDISSLRAGLGPGHSTIQAKPRPPAPGP